MFKTKFSLKSFAVMAILAYLSLFAPLSPANAALVTTSQTLAGPKARLISMIERQEVKDAIVSMGLDPVEATRRVTAMTDTEAGIAMNKLDTLPAGGDIFGGIIGAAIFIFAVLFITDIIGLTNVFGFSHHHNS